MAAAKLSREDVLEADVSRLGQEAARYRAALEEILAVAGAGAPRCKDVASMARLNLVGALASDALEGA